MEIQMVALDNIKPVKVWDFGTEKPHLTFFLGQYEIDIAISEQHGSPAIQVTESEYLGRDDYIDTLKVAGEYLDAFRSLYFAWTDLDMPDNYSDDYKLVFIAEYIDLLNEKYVVIPQNFREEIEYKIDELIRGMLPTPGYIYLVRAITPHNHYKIGLSVDPTSRIDNMGVKLPFPLQRIHTLPTNNMRIAEKQLHEQFSSKRLRGEWFELETNEVDEIRSISHLYIEDAS